jgi:UDP-glucose-4-epimerase GalE
MRVLVTGGAGYIGSVSVETLLAAGHEVDVLDDLSTGHRAAVPGGTAFHHGSYTDEEMVGRLMSDRGIDAVLHCGARSLVGESIADPARYYRQNVAGGVALLEAMRSAGVRRLVFSSSAAVYGTPTETPIREEAPLRPINPYGETKRIFESALRWYGAAYGLRSVSLRYFNAAGASDANGEDHRPETHLIPNVLLAAEGTGHVTIFGDDYPTPDGTCIRDYVHVSDLADAHLRALRRLEAGGESRAYNLGTGTGMSVRQVLDAIERASGRPVPYRVSGRRPGDPARLVARSDRAQNEMGWRASRSLDDIVKTACRWHERHPLGYAGRHARSPTGPE